MLEQHPNQNQQDHRNTTSPYKNYQENVHIETMATTQTTTTTHPTCTPFGNEALPKSGFFKRLSQWLWSVAYYDFTEGDETDYTVGYVEVIPEQQETTDKPCRRCRMEGIACNGKQPSCSQCLHEQVPCFYVDPLRITRKKKRKQSATTETG